MVLALAHRHLCRHTFRIFFNCLRSAFVMPCAARTLPFLRASVIGRLTSQLVLARSMAAFVFCGGIMVAATAPLFVLALFLAGSPAPPHACSGSLCTPRAQQPSEFCVMLKCPNTRAHLLSAPIKEQCHEESSQRGLHTFFEAEVRTEIRVTDEDYTSALHLQKTSTSFCSVTIFSFQLKKRKAIFGK